MTPKEVVAKLNEALKRFGTYHYYDKGSQEVLDLRAITDSIEDVDQVIVIIKALSNHEHGDQLASDILSELQIWPEEKYNEIFEREPNFWDYT